DIGSPRADDHEHLELPEMLEDPYVEVALQALPSPDYIHGPEEPQQAPPSPDYLPGPKHADDEIVAEDQPYAEDASPNAQSPEYVPESDFEAHPEEDDDEDPEEDPVDYLADGGDDGDNEEGSSEDDEDDDMDIEADEEEEEEEHPAPADFVVVASTTADQTPSAEETEPFETDEFAATPPPHPGYRMTAKISIPALVHVPAWSDLEIPNPPLPLILSPPSPVLSPAPPPSPIRSLGYRAAMIRLYEVGKSSSAAAARPAGGLRADYGFVATMDKEIMGDPERGWLQGVPVSTNTELGRYMREFETRVRQDTEEIYMRLDDEQSERQLLAGRLNMLSRDRHASDHVRGEVMSLRTTVLGQMIEIRELHAADRKRQTVISEMMMADYRRSTEIIELRTALQG
nr:hypothetical protein [Tanacetum cinerariifolium]